MTNQLSGYGFIGEKRISKKVKEFDQPHQNNLEIMNHLPAKGGFYSEGTDAFTIFSSNRRTLLFS